MEKLLSRIDQLITAKRLPWRRQGRKVRILLSQDGRSQDIHLTQQRDRYVLSSVIAHTSAVNEDLRSLAYRLWRRNALKAVVTFTIDRRERVVGHIDQPIASVHDKELKFYLETLARECDRLEYILTGEDNR